MDNSSKSTPLTRGGKLFSHGNTSQPQVIRSFDQTEQSACASAISRLEEAHRIIREARHDIEGWNLPVESGALGFASQSIDSVMRQLVVLRKAVALYGALQEHHKQPEVFKHVQQ